MRVERFKNNSNTTAYLYYITPSGLRAFISLSLRFLKIKLKGCYHIKAQIKSLYQQVQNSDVLLCENPYLLIQLRKLL